MWLIRIILTLRNIEEGARNLTGYGLEERDELLDDRRKAIVMQQLIRSKHNRIS